MKQLFAATALCMLFFSCTDTKKQEKDLLDDVIKIHDGVMAKEDKLMKNKMQLDTLLKAKPAKTAQDSSIVKSIEATDTKMEDWMHKFDAENKGKSHNEIMTYLTDQKKQIAGIDKQFDSVIVSSGTYIKTIKQ